MKVGDIMTKDVASCSKGDSLRDVARLMWDRDCGAIPVVDELGRVIGIITDRDICMAAQFEDRPLSRLFVHQCASFAVFTCREDDSLDQAEALMRSAQVRRLPIVDSEQRLRGILSIADLARAEERTQPGTSMSDGISAESVIFTLAAIAAPHGATTEPVGDRP